MINKTEPRDVIFNPAFYSNDVELKKSIVYPLFAGKELKKGVAKISTYKFEGNDNPLYNMRLMLNGNSFMSMFKGDYIKLVVDGELMMSDTNMERLTNNEFIKSANGDVLIGGLGIGLIIKPLLERADITSVTVIEKYKDVIDLVAPKLKHPKLTVVCADIDEWRPAKGTKFDTIYFDIWPTICTDNLPQMGKLHRAFGKFLNKVNEKKYINSWMRGFLKKTKRQEDRY